MMTYEQLYKKTLRLFEENSLEDASFQAKQLLLSHFTMDAKDYFLKKSQEVSGDIPGFEEKCRLVLAGRPLQYIIGQWEFMGFPFYVGDGVLIPRPETELLCQLALDAAALKENPVIFDLCAGSGCVGISVAKLRPDARVYLFEKSPDAVAYCKKNILLNQVQNVQIIEWDILKESYPACMADVILSNPPYIETDVIPTLQRQVRHEPKMALDGGADGLLFYRAIARLWLPALKDGGFLAVEHGEGQSGQIIKIFEKSLLNLQVHNDYAGHDRIVSGNKEKALTKQCI